MLPRDHRLTTAAGFRRALRSGRRSGSHSVVAHLAVGDPSATVGPVSVGFVVGRQVGGAVVRNRVRRRLRHLMSERLATLPPGATLVIRALPSAASASGAMLGADLDRALSSVLRRRAADRVAVGTVTG